MRAGACAMEFSDQSYDIQSEAEMRLVLRWLLAHRNHGFKQAVMHILWQWRTFIADRQTYAGCHALQGNADNALRHTELNRIGGQLVQHLRDQFRRTIHRQRAWAGLQDKPAVRM